jgi:hypothetical protein
MALITGGEKLKARLDEIAKSVKRGAKLRVGFLEGATYPVDQGGQSVAMVAAIQNFGAPSRGIPPRPFFTNMIKTHGDEWPDELAAILVATNYSATRALKMLGAHIEAELRQAIIDTNSPPLSAITLMLRKMRSEDQSLVVTGATVGEAARRVKAGESTSGVSDKALVDTGHLLGSVASEVTDV